MLDWSDPARSIAAQAAISFLDGRARRWSQTAGRVYVSCVPQWLFKAVEPIGMSEYGDADVVSVDLVWVDDFDHPAVDVDVEYTDTVVDLPGYLIRQIEVPVASDREPVEWLMLWSRCSSVEMAVELAADVHRNGWP